MTDRFCGMLGLAMRAGKVVVGSEQVAIALGKRQVSLVLYSEEASAASKKKIVVKCEFYQVKAIEVKLSTAELGRLLGKTYGPACVGIKDAGFSARIEELLRA